MFEFGANWSRFLEVLDEDRILRAEESLKSMLGVERLAGKSFLDVGSGSGLFSLAARRLGARVHSFDADSSSVRCTAELKRRYFDQVSDWTVGEGSALDEGYLKALGTFDIVYAWGSLHHTGAMWRALELVAPLVAERGELFIAIYNDQGWASRCWRAVKRLYNFLPGPVKWIVLAPALLRIWGPATVRDLLRGRPFETWKDYSSSRGMSPYRDVVDWVGGYPFEVARPEAVVDFLLGRGFGLKKMKGVGGGHGCNEFVFSKA